MDSKKFTRTTEDFVCEHCGAQVIGNGYTNHCPKCLWSKHVDINPGDRASACGALMEPISSTFVSGEYTLRYKCVKCGFERNNRTWPEDNFDVVIKLSTGK